MEKSIRKQGKVSVTVIIVVAFVIGIGLMALSGGKSPSVAGTRFMYALSQGDYQTLADLSYAQGVPKEKVQEQWKYTTQVVGPHYSFSYEIKGESKQDAEHAMVWMMFVRNAGMNSAYEERLEIPLVKTEDGWKVDIYSLSRDIYPGLPR